MRFLIDIFCSHRHEISHFPTRRRLSVTFISGISGEEISRKDDWGRRLIHVYTDEYIQKLFIPCSVTLRWHANYLRFVIGEAIFHACTIRDASNLWQNIVGEGSTECCISVMKEPMPSDFQLIRGLCICYFGGCCRLCYQPGGGICSGCGNNGCCRCANCGCACCECNISAAHVEVFCPMSGCKPWWATE